MEYIYEFYKFQLILIYRIKAYLLIYKFVYVNSKSEKIYAHQFMN